MHLPPSVFSAPAIFMVFAALSLLTVLLIVRFAPRVRVKVITQVEVEVK
jgi:hypothetical protein